MSDDLLISKIRNRSFNQDYGYMLNEVDAKAIINLVLEEAVARVNAERNRALDQVDCEYWNGHANGCAEVASLFKEMMK